MNRGFSIVSPLSNVAQSLSPESTPRWSLPVHARAQASCEARSTTEANHSPFVTKYRRKTLSPDLLKYLEEAFDEILAAWRCTLLEFGREADHDASAG
jgi:hypothetical protein